MKFPNRLSPFRPLFRPIKHLSNRGGKPKPNLLVHQNLNKIPPVSREPFIRINRKRDGSQNDYVWVFFFKCFGGRLC